MTIDRQVDVDPSDAPADASHYSISLPSIPARTGDGEGEPEGLRDRKVDDPDHTVTDGESPEFRLIKELDRNYIGVLKPTGDLSFFKKVSSDIRLRVESLFKDFHRHLSIKRYLH